MVQEIPWGKWFLKTYQNSFFFLGKVHNLDLSVQSLYDDYFWTSLMKHLETEQ